MTLYAIHLESLIAVAAGLFCGSLLLHAGIRRQRAPIGSVAVAVRVILAGLLGAAVVERFFAPAMFPWFGAVALATLAVLLLAAQKRVPGLVLLDVCAPPAALGYAVARAVQLAVPLGQRTAAIEAVAYAAIAWWLWQEGKRAAQLQRPRGNVFGEYLVLMGVVRLARLLYRPGNPAEASNGIASVVSIAIGGAIIGVVVSRFLRGREEHRILDHVADYGDALQPEYTPATPECPHPERWKMTDTMTAEQEVLGFLKSLVETVKPNLVVETGTFRGISTLAIAEGLRQNGFGRVVTIEYDPKVFAAAKQRIDASGLGAWIEYRNTSSLDTPIEGTIDILFSDSDQNIREKEVRHFLPQMNPHGIILVHDASSHYKVVREAVMRLENEGLISVVLLPTPRGLAFAQKRRGRA